MDQLRLKLQQELIASINKRTSPSFAKNNNKGRLVLDRSIIAHIKRSRLEKVSNEVNDEMVNQSDKMDANKIQDQDPNVFQDNERDDQYPKNFKRMKFQKNFISTTQVCATPVQNNSLTPVKKMRSQVIRDRLSEKKKFKSNSKKSKNAIIFELEKLKEYRVKTEVNTNMKIYEDSIVNDNKDQNQIISAYKGTKSTEYKDGKI
uniref:Uncharacterized protein n=2 Tax=Rhizophagus irregularis TaxID=588596 RepID=U9TLR3_RHIID